MELPKELRITVKGEVQASNLSEWKDALLYKIRRVDTDLSTDEDFVFAKGIVKAIKYAENQLKKAKDNAVSQAKDINVVFREIDEVAAEVRQVRLQLERQIKRENKIRRDKIILSGIESVKRMISEQSEDFQLTDHSIYLNRSRFESAIKGKSTTYSAKTEVNNLLSLIESEISKKVDDVNRISMSLNKLDEKKRLLFPDRSYLLALSPVAFESEKRKRLMDADVVAGIKDDSEEREDVTPSSVPFPKDEALNLHEAVKILNALCSGCDPKSGEVLNPNHLVRRYDVSSALTMVVDVMESILEKIETSNQIVKKDEILGSDRVKLNKQEMELYERLRTWRLGISRNLKIPAYIVLHNTSLNQIALQRPGTKDELLSIWGISPRKLEKYGDEILKIVMNF